MNRKAVLLTLFLALLFSCVEKENPRVAVSSVELSRTSLKLVEGQSYSLTASVYPSNATGKTITWTSSNTSVATVSDGTVSAVKEGEAVITASCGRKTADCTVSVNKASTSVSSVTLDKTNLG